MAAAVDPDGWAYESQWQFMYNLMGSQSYNPHFTKDGVTTAQREMWQCFCDILDRTKLDPQYIEMPSAWHQYWVEREIWATFWDDGSFPATCPEFVGHEVEANNLLAGAYEAECQPLSATCLEFPQGNGQVDYAYETQPPSVTFPDPRFCEDNGSPQLPTPRPTPYNFMPQGFATNQMNQAVMGPAGSPPFVPYKDTSNGPAAQQDKFHQRPLSHKHSRKISNQSFFPQNSAGLRNSRMNTHGARGTSKYPLSSPPIAQNFSQDRKALKSIGHKSPPTKINTRSSLPQKPVLHGLPAPRNVGPNSSAAKVDPRWSLPQKPVPRGPAPPKHLDSNFSSAKVNSRWSLPQKPPPPSPALPRNSAQNNNNSNVQLSAQPKPIPRGPAALEKTALVEWTPKVRAEARKAIFQNKGINYEPIHGRNEHGLPNFFIPCFAVNGLHAFRSVNGEEHFCPIQSALPKWSKIMFQQVKPGLMIIWPEVKGDFKNNMLASSDKLWEEFQDCWTFLKSWASQTPYAEDIIAYLDHYGGDAKAKAEANKLQRPTLSAQL